ncbi:cyclase, partial [Streptomyces sp. SID5998]|nr:cyclase [Streptomyces sp. SID5998]
MHTVEETIDIAVPVRTAYDQWTQFKSFPRFMTVVRRVEQVRPAVTAWVIGVGPVRREFEAEIVDQEPDSHVTWRSLERRPGHRGEVRFRPT